MDPNHSPFNGDTYIGPEIQKLLERFNIQTIIETGTWAAHTTRALNAMGQQKVITIDPTWEHLVEEFGPAAVDDLVREGIRPVQADSSYYLITLIHQSKPPHLFYIDSHGGSQVGPTTWNVNPILEELQQIASAGLRCRDKCVIAIHDFQVPGKEWGHTGGDWGQGWQHLNYELIQPYLEKIYHNGHSYHYNEQADGLRRGIIYVYPSQLPLGSL